MSHEDPAAQAAEQEAAALLAEALMVDRATIGPHTALGATPEWDSLAHMRLVLGLEAALGRELASEEVVGLADWATVVAMVRVARVAQVAPQG